MDTEVNGQIASARVVLVPAPALVLLRGLPTSGPAVAGARTTISELVRVVEALWPVVRPLSLDLVLGSRPADDPYRRAGSAPVPANWHLRGPAPDGVDQGPRLGRDQRIDDAAILDPPAVRAWMSSAVAATEPERDGDIVVPDVLAYVGSRARMPATPSGHPPESDLELETVGAGPLVLGTERDPEDASIWAAGPRGLAVPEPVAVDVAVEQASLLLTVRPGWTPWADRSRGPRLELVAALAELCRRGWFVAT